jgi:SAM-dependent methyltransferase
VLEVGAGVGGMVERLLERVNLDRVRYLAVDSDPTHLPEAARRLQAWAASHDARWRRLTEDRWSVETGRAAMEVHWSTGSLFDDLVDPGPFDVILAHAVLDLVDLDRALPRLLGSLRPGGVFYFTLNFDGLTAFLPEIDPSLDRAIVDAYHATMDNRLDGVRPSGDSRTGRRLLTELPRHGADLIAAGASDWIIFPRAGGYTENDALVLHAILDMVEASLQGSTAVPADRLSWWSARRRQQVADGTLAFIAHQLDVLGRKPRPSA